MNSLKGIIIGVFSSLIAAGIIYIITKYSTIWSIMLPLWLWIVITTISLLFLSIGYIIVYKLRVRKLVFEFTEGSFGNSYVYTWNYKRSKDSKYSAFGYEAIDIHTKTHLSEMNNEKVLTYGHQVPEETIKMCVQLFLIAKIDKRIGKDFSSILDYMSWIVESQKISE